MDTKVGDLENELITEIDELKGRLKSQENTMVLVLERLAVLEKQKDIIPKNDCSMKVVNMEKYKRGILVTGETFSIKNTLSENGGKWNRTLGGWVFTNSHLSEVIDAIRDVIREYEDMGLVIEQGIE
jgi:hypothetical protein